MYAIIRRVERLFSWVHSTMNSIRNRLPLKVLIPVLVISLFSIVSFAASVTVTTTSYSGQAGVSYIVIGCFTATSQGFQVVQSTNSTPSGTLTWVNGSTSHTAITAGHWAYQVKLTIAANATTSHLYTVTIQWNTGSSYATLGSLQFNSPATITAGQIMYFTMDTSVTSFNAPAAIIVTVA
jgi:hypothetical protein